MKKTGVTFCVLVGVVAGMVVSGGPTEVHAATNQPPQPVTVTNTPVPVTGTVSIANLPATQPVSGTVNVANLPATQPVSGTVSIGNKVGIEGPVEPQATTKTISYVPPTTCPHDHGVILGELDTSAYRDLMMMFSGGPGISYDVSATVTTQPGLGLVGSVADGVTNTPNGVNVSLPDVPGIVILAQSTTGADQTCSIAVFGRTG